MWKAGRLKRRFFSMAHDGPLDTGWLDPLYHKSNGIPFLMKRAGCDMAGVDAHYVRLHVLSIWAKLSSIELGLINYQQRKFRVSMLLSAALLRYVIQRSAATPRL